MAQQTLSAAAAGTFAIGGDLRVNRLGFGAMRITGREFGVRSPVIVPIPGTGSIAHLEENAAASIKLSDEEYESLQVAG